VTLGSAGYFSFFPFFHHNGVQVCLRFFLHLISYTIHGSGARVCLRVINGVFCMSLFRDFGVRFELTAGDPRILWEPPSRASP